MVYNPPAFPCEAQGDRSVPPEHDYIQTGIYSAKFPGMTLRDWFASNAPHGAFVRGNGPHDPVKMAVAAYRFADAMLLARATGEATPSGNGGEEN